MLPKQRIARVAIKDGYRLIRVGSVCRFGMSVWGVLVERLGVATGYLIPRPDLKIDVGALIGLSVHHH